MKTTITLLLLLFVVTVTTATKDFPKIHKVQPSSFATGPFPILRNSIWSYNDSGVDLGTSWTSITFDDTAWATGAGELGYGDGGEATVLTFGSNSQQKYPTYYFRYSFNVANVAAIGDLIMEAQYDDGMVIYINGVEVDRRNMPTGSISYNTFALNAIGGSDEADYDQIIVPNTLVNGLNTIAVEIHQNDGGSSDISFDFSMTHSNVTIQPEAFPLLGGERWNYDDTGIDRTGTAWNTLGFDVSTWGKGFAPLGYGDPVATTISFGPDPANKIITSYFTKEVIIDPTAVTPNVIFGLKRDDGAVVYINGVEAFRDNLPAGPINYLTNSSTIVSGSDEDVFFEFIVPSSMFNAGVNVIAVELHNRDNTSSDLRMDMYLRNQAVAATPYNCGPNDIACFTSIQPTAQTRNLIIPAEHRFQLLFQQGDFYDDGTTVPGNHDFTGYVPNGGTSSTSGIVSVNHENSPGGVSLFDVTLDPVTKLWGVGSKTKVDFFNAALVTTIRNCSGGITPWNTVITAEENTSAGDANADGYEDVGWLVEIDPVTRQVRDYGNGQEKLWAMGRMNHENVVVAADQITAYYGEDGGTNCVYKFVSTTPGDLRVGTLYVLSLDMPLVNDDPVSSGAQWIQIPNTTASDRNNVRTAAQALGGTNFNGVEDVEIHPLTGEIYFTSKGKDRVYKFTDGATTITNFSTFVGGRNYDLNTGAGLVSEPWGDGNDNLTFDNRGNLWVQQDGGRNYIWVVRPDHTQLIPNVDLFASMPIGSEPTGLTFTPDFQYGFFSVQHPSSGNTPQQDATFGNINLNRSATVVFALGENLGIQAPVSDFSANLTAISTGDTVTFSDLSTNNPTAWNWTFTGGTPATSTVQSPTVTYATAGNYPVSLTTTNIAGVSAEELKDQYIMVGTTGIDELSRFDFRLYPNPTDGILKLSATNVEAPAQIKVYDLTGRLLLELNDQDFSSDVVTIDLRNTAGTNTVFLVNVTIAGQQSTYKVIKNN